MKRTILLVLLGTASLLMTDCIVSYPTMAPPALRVEVIGVAPAPGYVWIAGYWGWSANSYVWVPGNWVRARPGYAWVPGSWEQHGRHWNWHKGYWGRH